MYTKRKIFAIGCGALLMISVGLNIAQFGKIDALSKQIANLQSAAAQNTAQLNAISSELSTLSESVSAGASLLSGGTSTVGLDESNRLSVTVSVTPKEIGAEDIVYISIGDVKEEAVLSGTVYTAVLPLNRYDSDLTPCVTILSPDGTQKQENLPAVSLNEYFELYYAFDILPGENGVTVDVGLQPSANCVLTLPEDIERIWVYAEDDSAKGVSHPMTPDGERIPEASGYADMGSSAVPADGTVTEAASTGLYYTYYTTSFDDLAEMGETIRFCCEIDAVGGLHYKLELGELPVGEKGGGFGGGGNIYPEWEE